MEIRKTGGRLKTTESSQDVKKLTEVLPISVSSSLRSSKSALSAGDKKKAMPNEDKQHRKHENIVVII
jgi:hypothetical protein